MATRRHTGRTGRPAKVPGTIHTKEKIIDASIDLFAERGYRGTSIRDIAKSVGITESAVYRHFKSKEAILDKVFDRLVDQTYAPLPSRQGTPKDASIFRSVLEGLPQYLVANPQLVKILHILFYEMNPDERMREFLTYQYGVRAVEYTEAMLRKEMEDGRIKECDPKALAILLNSFRFSWLFQNFIVDYGRPHNIEKLEADMELQIQLFEQLTAP